MQLKVTYAKGWGISFLACAVFILGTSFVIGVSLNTLTGAILLLVAILYLVNPALVYTGEELQVKNLFGGTVRRYSYQSDNVSVRDGALYAGDKKISLARFVLNGTEYRAMLNYISEKSAPRI